MPNPLLAIVTVAVLSSSALAESDLAFKIQDTTHQKSPGWIFDRLVTLEVGAKCMTKINDPKNGALEKLASDTRYIARYAKVITTDDRDHIENQTTGDKDKIRDTLHKMVDDFAPKFHITITVEGDDCDAKGNALWLDYTSTTIQALYAYPPKSGVMTVKIIAGAKTKEVKAQMNKDGTAITITGPRDLEPGPWADTIPNAFKRISTKG